MKKIFILLLLAGSCTSSFAFLTQSNWRWRNNDGTETTATWKAAQNVAVTYASYQEVIRLRIEVYNGGADPIDLEDSLQYSTTPAVAGSWRNILANDPAGAFMMAGSSAFVVQNEPTTSQITGNTYDYVPGKIMVDTAILKFITVPSSNRTEFEWTLVGTPNTLPNTTYYFRHWGSTANNLPPGVTYPTLTTSGTLAIQLAGFTVSSENRKVKLQWSTSSEVDNDRFEVERSKDGSNFTRIATVKGNGTSSLVHNYSAYDETPRMGINYYRLKQVDLNGHVNMSATRAFTYDENGNVLVKVAPNPASHVISFRLNNTYSGNVEALLTDMNGKVISRQQFRDVQVNAMNDLSLKQQPAPGVYILKLTAKGLSESIPVVIK
jgi:hypothetical protein